MLEVLQDMLLPLYLSNSNEGINISFSRHIQVQKHFCLHGHLLQNTNSQVKISSFNISVNHFFINSNVDAYLVTTKLAKIRRASLLIPTEKAFVAGVFHNIGRDGATYWSHAYAYPFNLN
jgi:hypothetical protein